MAKEPPTPMIRVCAWTGEDFEGKGIVLTTTDGTEVVSAAAFMAPWRDAGSKDAIPEPAPADDDQAPADPQPAPPVPTTPPAV